MFFKDIISQDDDDDDDTNKVGFTCMCLQSCPLAGNVILRQVMGHFNGTFIAVCSTPSSPLTALLGGTLEKFLLTARI